MNKYTCADCGRVGVRAFTTINGRTVCVSGVACNDRQPTRLTRVPAEPVRALPRKRVVAPSVLKPVAVIEQKFDEFYGEDAISVTVNWTGIKLDRPNTGGWCVGPVSKPATHRMVARLVAAINAGVACTPGKGIVRDNGGQTYVASDHHVSGKRMNADLRRLGY